METLAGSELSRYLRKHPEAMLIDVRPRQDFLVSHIRGAVNVPYESLPAVQERLPRDRELLFYCERGGSAMAAARRLSDQGYLTAAIIGAFADISRLTETASGLNI